MDVALNFKIEGKHEPKTFSGFFSETFSNRPWSRGGRQRRPSVKSSVTVQWMCPVYGVFCSVRAVLTAPENLRN